MNPTIRTASPNDKDGVLSLLNCVFQEQQRSTTIRGLDYWNWKFLDSPYGKSQATVAIREGKLIAIDNLWPWEFRIRGEIHKAMQPCDSVVHPEARGEGLLKKIRIYNLEMLETSKPSFLFNFPNNQSLPINISLGWNYLGKISWWVKILRPYNLIKSMILSDKTQPLNLEGKYRLDIKTLDDIAYESESYDKFVNINRIPGFHEYRYSKHPIREYGMVYFDKGKNSTASIFTINQKGTSREMIIVDLIGSNKNTMSIIKMTLKIAIELGVDFVAIVANTSFMMSNLWQMGFIKRKEKNMVVLPLDTRLEHLARSFDVWSLMAGLHDSI